MKRIRFSIPVVIIGLPALLLTLGSFVISCTGVGTFTPLTLNARGLADLESEIRSGKYGNIHSVIAVDRDITRLEWYFSGVDQRTGLNIGIVNFDSSKLHDVRSLTKSIVSILFGIALSEGVINSIDDRVTDYFPDYSALFTPETGNIRLRHLLTMTSGLGWDERTFPYGDIRNSETALDRVSDRIPYVLSLPIVAPPGERFIYSSGDVELIAQIISRSTHTPLVDFAREKLFKPLEIEDFEWPEYETGGPITSWGLRMRPRDMAKIGRLILNSGRWKGQQIISESWIETLSMPHFQLDNRRSYGYYWWFGEIRAAGNRTNIMQAVGNGGQRICIIPGRNVVIVTTAGFYGTEDSAVDRVISAIYSNI